MSAICWSNASRADCWNTTQETDKRIWDPWGHNGEAPGHAVGYKKLGSWYLEVCLYRSDLRLSNTSARLYIKMVRLLWLTHFRTFTCGGLSSFLHLLGSRREKWCSRVYIRVRIYVHWTFWQASFSTWLGILVSSHLFLQYWWRFPWLLQGMHVTELPACREYHAKMGATSCWDCDMSKPLLGARNVLPGR